MMGSGEAPDCESLGLRERFQDAARTALRLAFGTGVGLVAGAYAGFDNARQTMRDEQEGIDNLQKYANGEEIPAKQEED
jgi:hypothetical protein